MGKAARAIIIENGKILVMQRDKEGRKYFTLVGGKAAGDETLEETLVREVFEETGLQITAALLQFVENHAEPYNEQYIFRCAIADHDDIAIRTDSEEGFMNRIGINMHQPVWVDLIAFPRLEFVTPQLQNAICEALRQGFSDQTVTL